MGLIPAHYSYFTFKDDLHKVLCRHLALPGEALVGAAIALRHSLHDEVLPVEPSEANIVTGVDDLPVAIPRKLVLVRAAHAAGQRHLATHTAFHLPWADHCLQGLCKRNEDATINQLL